MLESEYDSIRKTHPDFTERWDAFLETDGLTRNRCRMLYTDWGLWRWRHSLLKMRELCRNMGVLVNNDFTLAPLRRERKKKQQSQNISYKQREAEVGLGGGYIPCNQGMIIPSLEMLFTWIMLRPVVA